MQNLSSFFLILLFLVLTLFACEKTDPPPSSLVISTPEALTTELDAIFKEAQVPGFAVSIILNDALIYQRAFGMADCATERLYTSETVQPIGSISKTFVAAAIVKAIEQGHFNMETPINDLLPFEVINPKQPNASIKVKHLVTHTAGLLDEAEAYYGAYHILPGQDLTTVGADVLLNGFGFEQRNGLPLGTFLANYYTADGATYSLNNFADAAPGTAWQYSNMATSLSAFIVESATGVSFDTYVKNNILQPLNMTSTTYDLAAVAPNAAAQLYWEKDIALPAYSNDSYPDGGIYSTNEDLAKFLQDMMKGARGQGSALFSSASYEMLFEERLPEGLMPAGFADNQGVFWFLSSGQIMHSGGDPGTSCNLQFDENGKSGYLLLTNMDASTDTHEANWNSFSGAVAAAINAFTSNQ
jgi:CubicO group peptidase (beta-lactamase class C family)